MAIYIYYINWTEHNDTSLYQVISSQKYHVIYTTTVIRIIIQLKQLPPMRQHRSRLSWSARCTSPKPFLLGLQQAKERPSASPSPAHASCQRAQPRPDRSALLPYLLRLCKVPHRSNHFAHFCVWPICQILYLAPHHSTSQDYTSHSTHFMFLAELKAV